MTTRLARLSILALLAAPGCAAIDDESNRHEENVGEQQGGIVGGVDATAYPEAALIDMYSGGYLSSYCSGAVIAPRVILTAGHCVWGYDSWKVSVPFANAQKANSVGGAVYDYETDAEYVDPSLHDVGLIFLDKDIVLSKYPVLQATKIASGTKVRNVGRLDDGYLSTKKLFVGASLSAYDGKGYGFPFDYVTSEVIESGDSGGPVFLSTATNHTIVAVNSGGGGGTQVLARVDLVKSWIDSQIKAHPGGGTSTPPPPADPCGGVSYAGKCDGSKVVWCENKQLKSIDCGASGYSCGWNSSASYYDCM
jgi:hypothetical protein